MTLEIVAGMAAISLFGALAVIARREKRKYDEEIAFLRAECARWKPPQALLHDPLRHPA